MARKMAKKYHPKYTAEFKWERLKELRTKKGLTQEVLAERCGCGDRHIRSLETGAKNPSATLLCKMACALDVSTETLVKVSVLSETEV